MTNLGGQLLAPAWVGDAAALVADALRDPAADGQVLELGGPETMPMCEVIARSPPRRRAAPADPSRPGCCSSSSASLPLTLLPRASSHPRSIDFINQPATVDIGPLMERMPRRLTPLEEALRTYLAPVSDRAPRFDEVRDRGAELPALGAGLTLESPDDLRGHPAAVEAAGLRRLARHRPMRHRRGRRRRRGDPAAAS